MKIQIFILLCFQYISYIIAIGTTPCAKHISYNSPFSILLRSICHILKIQNTKQNKTKKLRVTVLLNRRWKILICFLFYCSANMRRIQTMCNYSMNCLLPSCLRSAMTPYWMLGHHPATQRTCTWELLMATTKAVSEEQFYPTTNNYILSCSHLSCFLKCPWYSSVYLQILWLWAKGN